MAIDYTALARQFGATPIDAPVASDMPSVSGIQALEQKYGGAQPQTLPTVGQPPSDVLKGGGQGKTGGFFAGVARAVAPLGESVGSALATGYAKNLESQTTAQQASLTEGVIRILKNPNIPPEAKKRALDAYQKTGGSIISQSGAFTETPLQTVGKALGTFGSVVAGSGAAAAEKLGLTGAKAVAAKALAEGVVAGSTIGAGAGLAEGKGPWTKALETGAIAAALPVVGAVFGKATPWLANKLETLNLRLTPVQKTNLGSRLDAVTDFIRKNDIVGSPQTRFEKVTEIYNGMERKLQNFLAKNSSLSVPRSKIVQELEDLKTLYRSDRDFGSISRQIDEAKALLEKNYPSEVRLTRLNKLKRSTYEGAYSRTGNNKVLDDVEHAIGDVFRKNIEKATDGLVVDGLPISGFNKEYGTIITARKLLKTAAGRPEIGLVGRIISTIIGTSIGAATGGVAGGAIGTAVGQNIGGLVAGTGVRSGLANLLTRAETASAGVGGSLAKSPVIGRTAAQLKALALSALAHR